MHIDPDELSLAMPRLRRSDPSGPGITRQRRGKAWSYERPERRR